MTSQTPTASSPATAPSGEALLRLLSETVTADGTDLLGTRETAVPWLRTAGLLPADAALSGSEHGALLRLRDTLHEVTALHGAGDTDADGAARLTRALADGRLVVTVSPDGAARLASSARAPYSNLVAAVAIAVAQTW